MRALAITETSSFVHRMSLVASLAWQVSESRSPSNREGCGFEDIFTVGFSEDIMQPSFVSSDIAQRPLRSEKQ